MPTTAASNPATVEQHLDPDTQARGGEVRSGGGELEVSEGVGADDLGVDPAVVHLANRWRQRYQRRGLHGGAHSVRRDTGGEVRGGRREHVATVEGRGHRGQPELGGGELVRGAHPTERLGGRQQQPVVRADEQPAGGEHHHAPAIRAHPRIDDREVHGARQVRHGLGEQHRPAPNVLRRHGVSHVDHSDLRRDPGYHTLAGRHEPVLQPVVGGERDPTARHEDQPVTTPNSMPSR